MVFCSGCTILRFHQQRTRVPISPQPTVDFLCVLVLTATLTGMTSILILSVQLLGSSLSSY